MISGFKPISKHEVPQGDNVLGVDKARRWAIGKIRWAGGFRPYLVVWDDEKGVVLTNPIYFIDLDNLGDLQYLNEETNS